MTKIRVKKGKGGGALNSNDNGILFNSERNKDHVCRNCVGVLYVYLYEKYLRRKPTSFSLKRFAKFIACSQLLATQGPGQTQLSDN